MRPRKLKEKYPKSEATKAEVEEEKDRKEKVGWKCKDVTEEGDFWVLFCTAG